MRESFLHRESLGSSPWTVHVAPRTRTSAAVSSEQAMTQQQGTDQAPALWLELQKPDDLRPAGRSIVERGKKPRVSGFTVACLSMEAAPRPSCS